MSKSNDWTEVGGSGSENSSVWDYKTNKELIGIYQGKREHIGPNDQNMYDFDVNGEAVSVWGTAFLNNKLGNIAVGDEVKIVYEGKLKNPKTGREFNAFRIYTKSAK